MLLIFISRKITQYDVFGKLVIPTLIYMFKTLDIVQSTVLVQTLLLFTLNKYIHYLLFASNN